MPKDVLDHVRSHVDGFVGGAEQFDDLTMLCIEYKGPENPDTAAGQDTTADPD